VADGVSIVIPTINEAENIKQLIPQIEAVLKSGGLTGEIVVVDDKSTDGTYEEAVRLNGIYGNVKAIGRKNKDGLGNALKRGVEEARYGIVIFMDADLSHQPKEIPNFMEAIREYDVVVGSRFIEGSELRRSAMRKLISGTYNVVSKNVLGVRIKDITSGYRAFRKDKFKALNLESAGPEIHSELVVRSSIEGFRVGEIPVSYSDRLHGQTKLNYLKIGRGYSRVLLKGFLSKAAKMLRYGRKG
jgi:dolichol-phosphate mannosyltransferase